MHRRLTSGLLIVLLLAPALITGIVVATHVISASGEDPDPPPPPPPDPDPDFLGQGLWSCQEPKEITKSKCVEDDAACYGKVPNEQPRENGCSMGLAFQCRHNPKHCIYFDLEAEHEGECSKEQCNHPAHWTMSCYFGYVTEVIKPGTCMSGEYNDSDKCTECLYLTCMLIKGYPTMPHCQEPNEDFSCDGGFHIEFDKCQP